MDSSRRPRGLKATAPPCLHLVSDLDGTWIPAELDPAALERLEAFLEARPGIVLTFATGRTLASATALLASTRARPPRFLVTDVGTAIHERTEDGWAEDPSYAAWVRQRWDPDAAAAVLEEPLPKGIRPQPGVEPVARLALEIEPSMDPGPTAQDLVRHLRRHGMRADVLASHERYLDVLPRGVNKGSAVAYLKQRLGQPVPLVVCGDSENDLAMLRIADLAVVMSGTVLKNQLGGMDGRLAYPERPGPAGIQDVLLERLPGWGLA